MGTKGWFFLSTTNAGLNFLNYPGNRMSPARRRTFPTLEITIPAQPG